MDGLITIQSKTSGMVYKSPDWGGRIIIGERGQISQPGIGNLFRVSKGYGWITRQYAIKEKFYYTQFGEDGNIYPGWELLWELINQY